MGWRDIFALNKEQAVENNYKLDLFNTVSQSNEIVNMSVINRYFNQLYRRKSNIWLIYIKSIC